MVTRRNGRVSAMNDAKRSGFVRKKRQMSGLPGERRSKTGIVSLSVYSHWHFIRKTRDTDWLLDKLYYKN